MRTRKVLIVVENNSVPFDRRVWYESTTLRDAGWKVSVICPRDTDFDNKNNLELTRDASPEVLEGIRIFRFPLVMAKSGAWNFFKEYFVSFVSILKLSWKVRREVGFDVIHICNPPDIYFLIGLFYRILGSKFVFDHHDLFPEMVSWRFPGVLGKFFYLIARFTEYFNFRIADRVISTNESYMQIALERGNIPVEKLVVVRNGPKIGEFTPTKPLPSLRKSFQYMVCFAGIMGEEDGVMELVEIIHYIINGQKRKDILFVLIGDGPKRHEAITKISNLGLKKFVEFPGMIHNNFVLRQYISTSDVCVSPEPETPLNSHSTFIKVGEYMAIGKPIVAYDLKETRNSAGDAARYVCPGDIEGFGDAILDLIDDPEIRSRMEMVGRRRILSSLGWEHQQKNLLRAYTSL